MVENELLEPLSVVQWLVFTSHQPMIEPIYGTRF